jgi:hypothetical protein
MDKRIFIAQQLERATNKPVWGLDDKSETSQLVFYSLICLFTGWVIGILTIVFLSGG